MKSGRRVIYGFLLLLVFLHYIEGASRRGRRRDTLANVQGQLRALEEVQEELRGDVVTLQRSVDALTALVSAGLPGDCLAARIRGSRVAVVKVKPPGLPPRDVRCDQVDKGGGWTVVLARYPHRANHTLRENFNRTWKEYQDGFGDLHGEFWLGNDVLHALTSATPHQLYVTLKDWKGNTATGLWNHFMVGGEGEGYRLSVGKYQASSTSGDSLAHHHSHAFSTYDHDNDSDAHEHCAKSYGGGWWYFSCHMSHLTGAALPPHAGGHRAITWRTWLNTTGLKVATMMIRPLPPDMLVLDPAAVCPARNP